MKTKHRNRPISVLLLPKSHQGILAPRPKSCFQQLGKALVTHRLQQQRRLRGCALQTSLSNATLRPAESAAHTAQRAKQTDPGPSTEETEAHAGRERQEKISPSRSEHEAAPCPGKGLCSISSWALALHSASW